MCWHKWSKWKRVIQPVVDVKHPEVKLAEHYQERTCDKCGKIQREEL